MTIDERAAKAAEMAEGGFCTHGPGYTCDKGFPAACPRCIISWIIRSGIASRDDPRLEVERRKLGQ